MSVISNPTVVPSRLIALVGAIGTLGGTAAMPDIWGLLFPEPLRRAAVAAGAAPSMADELRREAIALHLVEAVGSSLRLTDAGRAFALGPRGWLADELTDPDRAAAAGQGEVPAALVWLLQQDPLEGLGFQGSHSSSLRELVGDRATISNMADFQQLFHWARYLGFCWWIRVKDDTRVIPDPSAAIRRAIAGNRLPVGERLPVAVFVQALGAACPVLEGGAARLALTRAGTADAHGASDPGKLSSATALALERLKADGVLRYESASDGGFMLGGHDPGAPRISHVTINGDAS